MQLANLGCFGHRCRPKCRNMAGILDSLPPHATGDGIARTLAKDPWQPTNRCGSRSVNRRVPLKVGLVCSRCERQQASLALLQTLLEDVINRPGRTFEQPAGTGWTELKYSFRRHRHRGRPS